MYSNSLPYKYLLTFCCEYWTPKPISNALACWPWATPGLKDKKNTHFYFPYQFFLREVISDIEKSISHVCLCSEGKAIKPTNLKIVAKYAFSQAPSNPKNWLAGSVGIRYSLMDYFLTGRSLTIHEGTHHGGLIMCAIEMNWSDIK